MGDAVFQQSFELAAVGMSHVTPDGRFVRVNRKLCEMVGYTREELLERTFQAITHPEDLIPDLGLLRRLLAGEIETYNLEKRYLHKSGSEVWVSLSVSQLKRPDGTPLYLLAVIEDITARKRAELELGDTQTALVNAMPGVAMLDREGRYQRVNVEYARMLGYEPSEVIGLEWTSHVASAALGPAAAAYQRMLSEGRADFEALALRRDGSSFLEHVMLLRRDRKDGVPGGHLRLVRDITDLTERRRAEGLLLGQKRVLEMIVLGAPLRDTLEELLRAVEAQSSEMLSSILLLDDDGVHVRHSAAPRLPASFVSAIDGSAIGERSGSCGTAAYRRQAVIVEDIETDPLWEDYRGLAAAHGLRACWSTPIFDAERRVLGTFALYFHEPTRPQEKDLRLIDMATQSAAIAITRKREEEALRTSESRYRQLSAELEERVTLRTNELHAKNRELETFTYSVSHDLKAPLRGIDGYSRLLLEDHADSLDEEGRGFLKNVRQATGQMSRLIDDLLAYSRLERRPMHIGQVELRALVLSLVADRAEEIETRRAKVTVEVPEVSVTADDQGLVIALRNLLENALKFTRDVAAPSIEVGGRVDEGACRIWVRDNGIGFDMKFHDRIFEVFQRLHRAEDYAGTGVGLALVRRALERMGGRAWGESEPGKGATFFLELPR